MSEIRHARKAGTWYENDTEKLKKQIQNCFLHDLGPGELPPTEKTTQKGKILGLVSPHAGYIYSGPIAAHGALALAKDQVPDLIVILGPNHTGQGARFAIYPQGDWETPLGRVSIPSKLVDALVNDPLTEGLLTKNRLAHSEEHSIELQLPFLQYIFGDFEFIPICILDSRHDVCLNLGKALGKIFTKLNKSVVLVASSDLTHFEPYSVASKQDHQVIEKIERFDSEGISQLELNGVSMCGHGPIITLLAATQELGAKTAKLLKYASSGDISGDKANVVGYASIIITK